MAKKTKPKWLGRVFQSKDWKREYEIIDEYPDLKQYYVRDLDTGDEFYFPIKTFKKETRMLKKMV